MKLLQKIQIRLRSFLGISQHEDRITKLLEKIDYKIQSNIDRQNEKYLESSLSDFLSWMEKERSTINRHLKDNTFGDIAYESYMFYRNIISNYRSHKKIITPFYKRMSVSYNPNSVTGTKIDVRG